MAKTTNVRSTRFLTTTTVVEYCGIINRWAFAFFSRLYGALDSFFFFIALCTRENSSSTAQLIASNRIPVHNIDRKFHRVRFTLVLEAKLESSNITSVFRQFPIQYVFVDSGDIHAHNVPKPPKTPRPQDGIQWLNASSFEHFCIQDPILPFNFLNIS